MQLLVTTACYEHTGSQENIDCYAFSSPVKLVFNERSINTAGFNAPRAHLLSNPSCLTGRVDCYHKACVYHVAISSALLLVLRWFFCKPSLEGLHACFSGHPCLYISHPTLCSGHSQLLLSGARLLGFACPAPLTVQPSSVLCSPLSSEETAFKTQFKVTSPISVPSPPP